LKLSSVATSDISSFGTQPSELSLFNLQATNETLTTSSLEISLFHSFKSPSTPSTLINNILKLIRFLNPPEKVSKFLLVCEQTFVFRFSPTH
jgi:hypothetical protein